MFAVSARTGQFIVGEQNLSEDSGPAVNPVEQKLYLMNVLEHLAAASMRQGFRYADEEALRGRYGAHTEAVRLGAERRKVEHINQAKREFARATGHYAMLELGVDEAEAQSITRKEFSDFIKAYGGARGNKARERYRKELERDVDDLLRIASEFNRHHNLRPYASAGVLSLGEESGKSDPTLSDRGKLLAMLYDPRAGFVPATNREKTLIMAFLDYLDNPEYPLGVNNQLFEVFVHQQKPTGRTYRDGVRTVETIAWEIGDYLADAYESRRVLVGLREYIADFSPDVKVGEEVDKNHAGLVRVVRYQDAMDHINNGDSKVPLKYGPLQTTEDRWNPKGSGTDPGKHKTMHSHYTAPETSDEFRAYLVQRIEELRGLNFGELRVIVEEAIENEVTRERFTAQRLREIDHLEEYRLMQPVSDAARKSLSQVQ